MWIMADMRDIFRVEKCNGSGLEVEREWDDEEEMAFQLVWVCL